MEKTTTISIQFQYKPAGRARPFDYGQEENLRFQVPYGSPITTIPIPAVGDTVVVKLDEQRRAYKVLTRNFSYLEESRIGLEVSINLVVTDVDSDEMLARLKE
jgi:hypothetical protein